MFEFTYEKEQAIERIREIQDIDGNDIVKIMEDRTKESMRRKRAEDVQDQLEDLRKENDEVRGLYMFIFVYIYIHFFLMNVLYHIDRRIRKIV